MAAAFAAPLAAGPFSNRPPPRSVPSHDDQSPARWGLSPLTAMTIRDHVATLTTYLRGQRVCGPRNTNASLHCVISGVAKTFTLLPNGQQKTIDLLFPGDFFFLDPRYADSLVVEALGKVSVIAEYRQHEAETPGNHRADISTILIDVAFGSAMRLQRHVLTMSHLRTTEKVGAFLLELSERLPERTAELVTLPISRYDIADYLGLAVESVSRSLSKLKSQGTIRMTGTRRIMITDRAALDAISCGMDRHLGRPGPY